MAKASRPTRAKKAKGAKAARGAASPEATTIRQAVKAFAGGRVKEAIALCEQVLAKNRRSVQALQLLGSIQLSRNAYDSAAAHFHKCLALSPRDPQLHADLARVLAAQGRHEEALERLDRALRLRPDHVSSLAGKADIHERQGDDEAALAVLEPFVREQRENAVMAVVYAKLALRAKRYDDAIAVCARHVDEPILGPVTHRHLHALAGKAYERLGDYDAAFEAYRRSNEIEKPRFDLHTYLREMELVMQVCSAEALAAMPRAREGSEQPIFVVGMPRCGSTLVEQILDAHPDVHGAGELVLVEEMAFSMMYDIDAYEPYPECLRALAPETCDALARTYLERLRARVPGGAAPARIVDKSLLNFRHLGLISLICPSARVVHCRRDPLDTCLSCYVEVLSSSAHPYTLDLESLGAVYRQYERMMAHWHEVLDLPILDVQYEELVADQQGGSRAIVEFCGLEWDDACLRFYETGRTVRTASYEQVRRPIYKSSVARHDRFAAHLGPLRAALAGENEAR